jgi:hypothetical protein
VRATFGDRVADIFEGGADDIPDSDGVKAPWRARKEAYLSHLRAAPPDTLLVSACDKLHNARAIAADVRSISAAVFTRFKAGRDGTLWYYGALLDVFGARMGDAHPLVVELRAAVADMRGGRGRALRHHHNANPQGFRCGGQPSVQCDQRIAHAGADRNVQSVRRP